MNASTPSLTIRSSLISLVYDNAMSSVVVIIRKQTDIRRGKHNLLVGSNKGILETVMFNLLQVQRAGPLAFAKFQLDCCRDVGLGSLKL